MTFDVGESWGRCNWYNGDPDIDDVVCKQTSGGTAKVIEWGYN